MKAQYGYSDGTGEYFITIDSELCDGCGDCIDACPVDILVLAQEESGQPKATVKETVRKRLAFLCSGFKACSQEYQVNCHSVCRKGAIDHSW